MGDTPSALPFPGGPVLTPMSLHSATIAVCALPSVPSFYSVAALLLLLCCFCDAGAFCVRGDRGGVVFFSCAVLLSGVFSKILLLWALENRGGRGHMLLFSPGFPDFD